MELIPAIDVLGGQVVRLRRGRYDDVTVYSDDPVAKARSMVAAGARRLHVVDLDGARDGKPGNLDVIRRMVETVGNRAAVQVGGGVRDEATVALWRSAGAAKVVLGTAALENAAFTRRIAEAWPDGVIVAVDAKGDEVVVKGWVEGTGREVRDVVLEASKWGVAAFLFTSVAHDGTGEGPDIERTLAIQAVTKIPVIASGGIGTLGHVRDLARRGVHSAVCGRALLEGAFSLDDAFSAAREG